MPVLVWHGPAGCVTGELLRAGRCHIFHEDAREVSEADLLGLPASWEVGGAYYCCAQLACGHTFHVSALAWHYLYRDMRCPICRRGVDCRMSATSLPDRERSAFVRRLEDADAADSDAEGADDSYEGGYSTDSSDRDRSEAVLYEHFAAFERQLRLVVEVRSGAREVYVYESPVHCMHQDGAAVCALEDACGASESLVPFRVQRSFARHIGTRVASCAAQDGPPISLHFLLTHPLFQSRLEGVAVVSPTAEQCDFQLRRVSPSTGPTMLIGVVRVRLGSASVQMALEPRFVVALWCEGL